MYDLFLTWSLTMGNFSYLDGRLLEIGMVRKG